MAEYYKPSIDLEKVRHLAGLGLNLTELAGCLGMSAKTFSRRREQDAAIDQAVLEGRSHGIAEVAISLKARAVDGDPAAIKLFMQSLGGNFGKTQKVEISAVPSLVINLSQESPAHPVSSKPNNHN